MQTSQKSAADTRKILTALDYRGVSLGPCRQREQLAEACDTFEAVDNDALLYPFRIRKGMPAPGRPLRGWYGEGMFNNFGQFLTVYARIHAATGRPDFADKARALVIGWEETIEDDGFFLNSRAANSIEYCFDKLVCGLLDVHEYVGCERALPVLERISRWMEHYGIPQKPYAWSGFGLLEWYTLSEYLLRAFAVTGNPLFRELADRYRYDEYYEALRERDVEGLMARADAVHNFYQAHSHVNTLNSAAAFFEQTGDAEFLEAAIAGYDVVQASQVFATGMFGPLEAFMKPRQRTETLHSETGHAEISCPSWAMMRLVRHLIELTGEARYGDWMELNFYNGIGAAPATRSDGRAMQYFADYGLEGARKTWGVEWSCCSTTNGISMAEYINQIYYTAPDVLHVCLYVPSVVECELGGVGVRVTQRTAFPEDEVARFEVEADGSAAGAIAFRIPAWASLPPSISVGGEPAAWSDQDGWAVVERTWESGDAVEVTLPMELEAVAVEPALEAGPVALRYGPVVLVVPEADGYERLSLEDVAAVRASLRRTDPGRLAFEGRAADGRAVRLCPYFEIDPGEPYAMHFDDAGDRRSYSSISFGQEDAWGEVDVENFLLTERRRYMTSDAAGSSFAIEFEGTGVLWCGYRNPHAGYADVFIDGNLVERVTQLGHSSLQPSIWSSAALPRGSHQLRVVVSGEAAPGSRGAEVNVEHLRVLP